MTLDKNIILKMHNNKIFLCLILLLSSSLHSAIEEGADISFKCNRVFESRKEELVKILDNIDDEKQIIDSVNSASKAVLLRKETSLNKRKDSLDKKEKVLIAKLIRLNNNIKRNKAILKQIEESLLSKITKAYTKMSPAKAGGIFEVMKDGEAASILFLLQPKVMSNILSKMTPAKSSQLTLLIKQGPPFKKDVKSYAIKKPDLIEKAIKEDFK